MSGVSGPENDQNTSSPTNKPAETIQGASPNAVSTVPAPEKTPDALLTDTLVLPDAPAPSDAGAAPAQPESAPSQPVKAPSDGGRTPAQIATQEMKVIPVTGAHAESTPAIPPAEEAASPAAVLPAAPDRPSAPSAPVVPPVDNAPPVAPAETVPTAGTTKPIAEPPPAPEAPAPVAVVEAGTGTQAEPVKAPEPLATAAESAPPPEAVTPAPEPVRPAPAQQASPAPITESIPTPATPPEAVEAAGKEASTPAAPTPPPTAAAAPPPPSPTVAGPQAVRMPSLTPPTAEVRACPVCGTRIREGELACSFCGHVLTQQGKTAKFDEETEVSGKKSWPTGEVLTTEQKPITFEIEGKQLTLMIAESITVGRNSDIPGDALPDVDLGPYGAGETGVSRRHIRIRRKGILLYVADLNSTNGTLLNGRKLIPEGERLIRSGDELRLGHLKIRVKF